MCENATGLRVLGCDVAKDSVVIYDSATGKTRTVANSLKALRPALKGITGEVLVVCEATGGYEADLLAAAGLAGLPAHRGDPRKTSAFLRSLRSHGKTDAIDAEGLARYGLERHDRLPRWQPPSKTRAQLDKLVRLRADLVAGRADYKRRLKAPGASDGPDKHHIKALIESFTHRIDAVEDDIAALVKTEPAINKTVDIISAIEGCGHTTATTLAATMPELGQISRRQAAALAGLAPHPHKSGKKDPYRSTRGGRQHIKTALFIAAMTARRYNPKLKAFYERLIQNGKKPIVAIIAVARKLITIINAKVRDEIYNQQNQLS